MAWRYIRQPNGRYAIFSEIVDHFTWLDLPPETAIDVGMQDYHIDRATGLEKLAKAALDLDPRTNVIGDGLRRWREALEIIRRVHGDTEADSIPAAIDLPTPADTLAPDRQN